MDVQQNSAIFSYGNYPDQLYYGRSVYYFGSGPYTIPFRFTVPRRHAGRLFRHRSMENHRAASYHQPPPPLSSAVLSLSRFNASLWHNADASYPAHPRRPSTGRLHHLFFHITNKLTTSLHFSHHLSRLLPVKTSPRPHAG